ncbi:hypothetical protein ABDD95_00725 [Mucilaginibacter sp. PAMB04274]|uniref:hypothetical protein n=1 Tax=Mucilaginibacter sp. PAMB04274 TaxID=3138568 RepID=UPI0031F6343E
MAVEKFTLIQKERLGRLEPALKKAVLRGDLNSIKSIIIDLQSMYLATGNEAKLLMAKNRWLEVEMDQGNLVTAERGLIGIRIKANNKTRVYLEATTLLAICYLRSNTLEKAEPLIKEVLTNDTVIKSPERRLDFRRLVIERFDEEAVLYAIKSERISELISDTEMIMSEAVNLAGTYSTDKLYENLGLKIPKIAKDILSRVDTFSKRQLPSAERLKLPSPTLSHEDKKVGKTVFSSIKRNLYKSLCDKEGDINKKINTGLLSIQTTLTVAVTEVFNKLNIGIKIFLVNVLAIIIKLGLDVYCDMYKPVDVMDLR